MFGFVDEGKPIKRQTLRRTECYSEFSVSQGTTVFRSSVVRECASFDRSETRTTNLYTHRAIQTTQKEDISEIIRYRR